ncbi:MAG TPA: putative metal-dependent hydrolase [Vicinamibacteria bacterium]
MDDLRYPVGEFQAPAAALSAAQRTAFIDEIDRAPAALRAALLGLGPAQLDTPYRPGGWTLRQVAHHVPDSHMNAYVRVCLALTEDEPTIKPYAEDRWAELKLARTAPVEMSLELLELVHRRLVMVLREISPPEWVRRLRHPERGVVDLDWMLAQYEWHGRHHVGHVASLRRRMGWA